MPCPAQQKCNYWYKQNTKLIKYGLMLIVEMKFSTTSVDKVRDIVVTSTIARSIVVDLPPGTTNEDALQVLSTIQNRYGRPYQITVNCAAPNSSTKEEAQSLNEARRRVFDLVLSLGYKRKYLSPFAAVQSSRFKGVVQPEERS